MIQSILIVILGFALLIKGADFLVYGASNIAKKFHIPEIVIGLTIVSIGTSMPEFVISLTSSLQGLSDIAIGNVIGSNFANVFLILGSCAVISKLKFQKETQIFELPFTIIITILLFTMCINSLGGQENVITRSEGFILIIFFALFIIYNLIMARKGESFDGIDSTDLAEAENIPIIKSILGIVLGIIGLKFGGDFVVDGAVEIATLLGISQQLISLTIVAISTSLPELITSITATLKKETDMAIGNVIGSCIFNILLIIGMSSIISPITYSISFNKDIILLIIGTIILGSLPFTGKTKNAMSKFDGACFLIIYTLYLASLVCFSR